MPSLPHGVRHPTDGRQRHCAERPHDHVNDDGPAYAGETLDAASPQVKMSMSNPPTAQASSSGMEVTDGGTESESTANGDDQSDGDAEDDPSSGGSSPHNAATVTEGTTGLSPSHLVNGTRVAAASTRIPQHNAGVTGVEA